MKQRKKKKTRHTVDDISKSLNEKQKLFCELFTRDKDCFGNASRAYRTAYNLTPSQYKAGKVSAHHLLTNPNLQNYINKLLDSQFNDISVDRQLSRVIQQDKDLPSKVAAIKEANKLKQRITEKLDVTTQGEKIIAINYIKPDGNNTRTNVKAGSGVSNS